MYTYLHFALLVLGIAVCVTAGHGNSRAQEAACARVPLLVEETSATQPQIGKRDEAQGQPKRKPELTLTESEVQMCFGTQARQIQFLRNAVSNQKRVFASYRDAGWDWLQGTQIATVILGAVATIMLGLGSATAWTGLKTLAIVPTALVTAVTALDAFYDFRGSVARNAKARNDIATLESRIEIALLEVAGSAQQYPAQVPSETLRQWFIDMDTIVKNAGEQYAAAFAKTSK